MTTILALDPGRTVGWAMCIKNVRVLYKSQPYDEVMSGQCKDLEVVDLLTMHMPDILIMESFKAREKMKIDTTPLEVIGMVKSFQRTNMEQTPIFEQSPAQVKHFWTDAKLKKLGAYRKGMPHANDALRHLFYHLSKTDRKWIEQLAK